MKYLISLYIPIAVFVLSACGGGGGGGGSPPGPQPVVYTGPTTPAVVTNANAGTLAEGVIGGSTTGTALGVVSEEEKNQQPTTLDVARILSSSVTQLDLSGSTSQLPGAIVSESGSESCLDGGRFDFDLSVDDVTFELFGTMNFISCTEGDTTLNGDTQVSGSLFGDLHMTFVLLTVVSGGESYSMTGTVTTSVGFGVTIVMNVNQRNNITGLVEKLENLTIYVTDNFTYVEMSIWGRYYHPDHGYVDIVTDIPFQIDYDDDWPYLGQMTLTGAANSKVRITAISNTQYSMEVDPDGDDLFDPPTVEDWGS